MAMQRTNPMPPGRYWVDVFAKDWTKFRAWLSTNKASLHVDETKSTGVGATDKDDYGNAAVDSYLFTVKAPVNWEGPGYATIAGPNVKSLEDTIQAPDPEMNPLDKLALGMPDLSAVGGTIGKVAMGVVVVGVLGLAVWFGVSTFARQRNQSTD